MAIKLLVKEKRLEKNIGLRQLSIRCGISAKQLVAIENGGVDPKISTICKIAFALGVEPSALFKCNGTIDDEV